MDTILNQPVSVSNKKERRRNIRKFFKSFTLIMYVGSMHSEKQCHDVALAIQGYIGAMYKAYGTSSQAIQSIEKVLGRIISQMQKKVLAPAINKNARITNFLLNY